MIRSEALHERHAPALIAEANAAFGFLPILASSGLMVHPFVTNRLYPRIRLAWLPAMLGYAAIGAILAGVYGAVHDQITYSISPEYFTRLKFSQFRYANFGLPPRVFVAEIGFLATWWVGFIATWFITRITVPAFPPALTSRHTIHGFLIIFAFAFASSTVGYVLGLLHGSDYWAWEDLASKLGIVDVPSFVRVAYIHNASYLGGLIGLVAAILHLQKIKNINPRREVADPTR
jgi:hypothetical protein